MTPAQMLHEARTLTQHPQLTQEGAWARSAAFLARQALEQSVRQTLIRRFKLCGHPSLLSQFLASHAFLPSELAGRAAWTWEQLSAATHHHSYELPPTARELERWMGVVEEVLGESGGAIKAAAKESG